MAKIQTPNLHQTPGGKIGFQRQLQLTTQCAREQIAELIGSRKPDMGASGAIHAVALLSKEVSTRHIPVSRMEVDYWRETFFAWFKRVKRYFPDEIGAEYLANATADFEVIWDRADTFAHHWEQTAACYETRVKFLNRAAFDAARTAAKEKYPVNLGIALDAYLQACVRRLVNDDDTERPLVVKVREKPPGDAPGTVSPRIICFDDGGYSLVVTSFGGFNLSSITAYSFQNAVKKYLKANSKETLKSLNFDSESSMFCVRSEDLASLSKVTEVIYTLVADPKVRDASFSGKNTTGKKKALSKKKSAKRTAGQSTPKPKSPKKKSRKKKTD